MEKNVILISIDCLRYDRLGLHGHRRNTTPFLDKLSNQSVIFDNAFSTGPYTTESVPGFIAGHHSYNGSYFNSYAWKAIADDSETIASYLRKKGFQTVAVLSNPHLTKKRNFDIGFDTFWNLQTEGDDPKENTESKLGERSLGRHAHNIKTRMREYNSKFTPYTVPYLGYRYLQYKREWPAPRAEVVLKNFLSELRETSSPFFGWTHLMDLHAPIHPDVGADNPIRNLIRDIDRVASLDSDDYLPLYDAAVEYVDKQLAWFVNRLQDSGKWEDTVLIITADHGEALHDRNNVCGHPRHHHYDELLHVPLIIRDPKMGPRRNHTPVSLAWLHELLAECLSLPKGEFPTESGSNGLLCDEPPAEYILSDTLDENGHTISVHDRTWKYIRHDVSPPDGFWYEFGDREQAYRYVSDRGERVPEDIRSVESLKSAAESVLTRPERLAQVEGEFTRDVEQQLSDLGYKM